MVQNDSSKVVEIISLSVTHHIMQLFAAMVISFCRSAELVKKGYRVLSKVSSQS